MNRILAFGNPLLDTTIFLKNNAFLIEHNLKNDDEKEIGAEEMSVISKKIQKYETSKTAGGSAQNTVRIIKWMLGKTCSAVIVGSTGKDNEGSILKSLLEQDGVETRYVQQNKYQTGQTIAFVNNEDRSLVACLGAAKIMSLEDLLNIPDMLDLLAKSNLIYVESFFLTERETVAKFILNFCGENNKRLAFNISAQYMCEEYPNIVKLFSEKCDILFGNNREFEALSKICGHTNIDGLIADLVANNRKKIIVITNGAKSVRCIYDGGNKNEEKKVPELGKNEIVDTTGAGDAFVGGFLSGIILGETPKFCVELGCYAAKEIIKRTGCTLPSRPPEINIAK